MEQEFDVWLPWTAYVVYLTQGTISDIYLYAIDGPFTSLQMPLYLLPIPNYHTDGRFCKPREKQPYNTIAEAVSLAYQIVWDSGFNKDITTVVNEYLTTYAGDALNIFGIAHEDIKRMSPAGLLHGWSQKTKQEILSKVHTFMRSQIIPNVRALPTFIPDMSILRFSTYAATLSQ